MEGVILAAGFSSRAGSYKMALEINGETVIERCVKGMYCICSRIIVVVGYKAQVIKEILDEYPKVEIVYNRDYEEGMFSSVKEGFKYVQQDRFFFIPGDYPLVNKKVYKTLSDVSGDIIIPTYNGRKGHPVLISRNIAEELLRNKEFTNLRDFINYKGFIAVPVEDEGILIDIDTSEDYLKAKNKMD